MALFNPSTIPWVSAVQQIADAAGASADSEMLVRAHNSLRASFQYFNGKYKWDFTRTEADPLTLVAPFSVAVTASAGQASASSLTGHGLQVDDILIGSGLGLGARVCATAASGFSFNVSLTGFTGSQSFTVSAERDLYDLPADWKSTYSMRLLSGKYALRYLGRRAIDRTQESETDVSTPYWYDLFRAGSGGKLRLLPPPAQVDILLRRYYRRMFLASASGVTTALDIPEDYESYPIAWAKWHFLTDKGEGRKDQATTWLTLAQEGLKTMLADQTDVPDEDLSFQPGHATTTWPSDRSTRGLDWNY